MIKPKIALLVFALSDKEEIKQKPFLAQGNLIKSLHAHTKSVISTAGLPVIYFDETLQKGNNFGSRFTNAIQYTYDQGYDAIITIGNDCPYLQPIHIHKAKNALENGNSVLGPTYDGGFYLMGISKESFNRSDFLDFSWNSEVVYEQVRHTFSRSHKDCIILEKLRDIDYLVDIEQLSITRITNNSLRNSITSIQSRGQYNHPNKELNTSLLVHKVILNKGSPLYSYFQF